MSDHLRDAIAKYDSNYIYNWRKPEFPDEKRFTREEACALWSAAHEVKRGLASDQRHILFVAAVLDEERGAFPGVRCSVCGGWQDDSCAECC